MIRNHFNAYELIQGGPLAGLPGASGPVEHLNQKLGQPMHVEGYPIWAGYLAVFVSGLGDRPAPALFTVKKDHEGVASFFIHYQSPANARWGTRQCLVLGEGVKPLELGKFHLVQYRIQELLECLLEDT